MAKAKITDAGEFAKLPKDLQAEYLEKDGAYLLKVDPVDGIELTDAAGLKTALSKERKDVAELRARVAAFGDLDPEKARKAIEQHVDLANMTPNDKVKAQIDATVQQLKDQHRTELEKLAGENKSLYGQLEDALINAVGTQALSEEKGDVDLLLPHVRSSTRIKKDPKTGRLVAVVMNPDGETERIGTKSTDPMTIREFIATDLKKKFPAGFAGTQAAGSGADAGTRGGAGATHQITAADARDPAKYRAARAVAEKAGRPLDIVP